MPLTIYITRDFEQMSRVGAGLAEADIKAKQAAGNRAAGAADGNRAPGAADEGEGEYVLGLATGSSPTGLYKHLAAAFNQGRLDPGRVRTFNLDEYVGLPGQNAQQRCLHPESYTYFMIQEFFGLLDRKFVETIVPWGTLIEQEELVATLRQNPGLYELQGMDQGKAVVIKEGAQGVLGWIKTAILDAYERKIKEAGGIDLQIIGVGGRGHVAFHESGIPFEDNRMLLVRLDDSTVENAVRDGHFASVAESPRYAISMGAELVYEASTVLLLANGQRKTAPVAESLFGEVTCEVPISYGQKYAAEGGNLMYVLEKTAAAGVLARSDEAEARGYKVVDLREEPGGSFLS